MGFFDQRYYAFTKAHMSRIGIWPEQSKYVRIILPLTIFAISLTLIEPMLIRLHDGWSDINILARNTTALLMGIAMLFSMFSSIQHDGNMKLSLKYIEKHWEMLKNTPAVFVLDKYTERGRYITIVYAICLYATIALYFCLSLSHIIHDFIDPVNETRPKVYVVEAEYGVDVDKYYWFILAHTYLVIGIFISIIAAIGTMYILSVVHACALFEAVAFSDLIEDVWSTRSGVSLGTVVIISVISGVQALINWNHPEMLIQQGTLIIGEILHVYVGCLPGQELMNHSEKIHTAAYNLDWQDMPVNAQRLLIPILIRSSKPCYFTAGKVYVLSMETFSSVIRTVLSYFMVFAQMI